MEAIEFEGRLEKYKPALIAWLDTVNRTRLADYSSVQINDEDFPPTIIAYLFFGEPEKAIKLAKLMLHDNVRANMGFECIQRILTSFEFMSERLRVNNSLHANFTQAEGMRDILGVLQELATDVHQQDKVIDGFVPGLISDIVMRRESIDHLLAWISDCATKNAADLEAEENCDNQDKKECSINPCVKNKGGEKATPFNEKNNKRENVCGEVLGACLEEKSFQLHQGIDKCIQDFHAGRPILQIQNELVLLESKLVPVDIARARYALADLTISKLYEHLKFVSDSTLTIKAFRWFDKLVCDNQALIDEFSEELVVLRKKEKEVKTNWSSFVDELVDIKKLYSKRGRLICKVAGK
ncbi:hypothetical protein CAPTEDRAFT_205805, partial [Capitella teleta]